ncbi:hypothetical protein LAZ67_8002078 [Cordylochernes scorpioides]|uniref:Uncharacterized protein n=1 Tax=Cordylochernes scorpioides TaxID=51811 RepID=A0ABY6KTX5_9ARAC|nr:hypothetical protein LAZ67_8002078 [Cordylochernes scorpioides]
MSKELRAKFEIRVRFGSNTQSRHHAHTQELTTEEIQELQSQQHTEVMQVIGFEESEEVISTMYGREKRAKVVPGSFLRAGKTFTMSSGQGGQVCRNKRWLESTRWCKDCGYFSVQNIVSEVLGYKRLSARWVPKKLIVEHKIKRVESAIEFLYRYEEEGEEFLDSIVTGN